MPCWSVIFRVCSQEFKSLVFFSNSPQIIYTVVTARIRSCQDYSHCISKDTTGNMNETLDASSGTKVIEKVGAKNTVDLENVAVKIISRLRPTAKI